MAGGIFLWREERKRELSGPKHPAINLDNGPECNGHRGQFLFRMTEFAGMAGLRVRLVCYPHYRGKHNGIERYWAGLERSWNGYLPGTVDTVLNRAGNFIWEGVRTVARLPDAPYEKGVKVCGNEKIKLEQRLQRSTALHWWDITIYPKPGEPEPNRWLSNLRQNEQLGRASKFGRSADSRPLYLFLRMQVELIEPLWVRAAEAISC